MTHTAEVTTSRVVSRDGTEIAYWTSGEGSPLVLVHGTTSDHTTWRLLLPHLEPYATLHAMDRRGRGASADGPDYALAREFEDVAAVVDAVAAASGSAVDVVGHSFGGVCAFGAATLTANIRKLVLYEGWPLPNPDALVTPPAVLERLDAWLAAGGREAALEAFYREVVLMSEAEVALLRAAPTWPARVAAAHTITREDRAISEGTLDPEEAAKMPTPVLMLVGEGSPDSIKADYETVAAALPDVRVTILKGQQHIAHLLIPEVFATHVVAFLRDRP